MALASEGGTESCCLCTVKDDGVKTLFLLSIRPVISIPELTELKQTNIW